MDSSNVLRSLCKAADPAMKHVSFGVASTKVSLRLNGQGMRLLLAEPEDFVSNHRPHGELVASEGDLTPNGYRLTVSRPCGVTFERWITPEDAMELKHHARLTAAVRFIGAVLSIFLLGGCTPSPVRILSGFGSGSGPEGTRVAMAAIEASIGTGVIAPADGTVMYIQDERDAFGKRIIIRHLFGH